MAGSSDERQLNLHLKVWRQKSKDSEGKFEDHKTAVSSDASFLELLDEVNEKIITEGGDPISFDHDCREGICGSCGVVINGDPHGPLKGTATCQLHMRHFKDGDTIVIEPFRAKAFPLIKDLSVDRRALDRIVEAGAYISVNTGNAPDANAILVPKDDLDLAFSGAECIGCGACVAACKNASAALFTGAAVSHFSLLPQGRVEENNRASRMVAQMDEEGFGACSTTGSCMAACPKEISLENIARMNRKYLKAKVSGH